MIVVPEIKQYGASVDWASSAKILISSGVSGAIAYSAVSFVSLSSWPKLILGLGVFAAAFLLTVIVTQTLRKPVIDNLRLMTTELCLITSIIDKILKVIERLMNLSIP